MAAWQMQLYFVPKFPETSASVMIPIDVMERIMKDAARKVKLPRK